MTGERTPTGVHFRDTKKNEDIREMPVKDLIKMFGGWNEGHFVFRTGEHGNGYIEKMGFLKYPEAMTEIGRRIAEQNAGISSLIDLVVGPSIIGSILAYSVSQHIGVPFTVTYRRDGKINFHRGFIPDPGSRCLLVDDFTFSGKDLSDNVGHMQESGIEVSGASVIGMREEFPLSVPLKSLMKVEFTKTSPEKCQMCVERIPITAENIRE